MASELVSNIDEIAAEFVLIAYELTLKLAEIAAEFKLVLCMIVEILADCY